MPLTDAEAREVVRRRHHEWHEHELQWRWLLDSYEGGERYRNAVYGTDRYGLPVRNLIRHKREYPDPHEMALPFGTAFYAAGLADGGADPGRLGGAGTRNDAAQWAADSDYELRRARTPVPTFVRECCEAHLSKIYAREVSREGPEALASWWADVDGRGTPAGDWMRELAAPLFLALGQLDVLVDHPRAPAGAEVRTRADAAALGLTGAALTYILPENLVWWRLNPNGTYREVLVRERHEDDDDPGGTGPGPAEDSSAGRAGSRERYRHWDAAGWTLLDGDGTVVAEAEHPYGRVPVVRVFDRRKPRCRNVGQPRYEGVAERQREYYNRDSELILSDTTQAHPLLQGPEDFVQADGTIPIGPSWLLPKKKNTQGGAASYEGFDVVDFPKGAAESIRKNKQDIRDDVDRDARRTKPAGVAGGGGATTVSQSGVSKMLDHDEGHDYIAEIARALARFETAVAELALTVLNDGPPTPAEQARVAIAYPTNFSLRSAEELAAGLADFQSCLANAGACPEVEAEWLEALYAQTFAGLPKEEYAEANDAIERAVAAQGAARGQAAESAAVNLAPAGPPAAVEEGEGEPPESGAAEGAAGLPAYSNLPGYPAGGPY